MRWVKVYLNEIATILGGGTPRRGVNAFWNGNTPWLTPTDLPKIGEGILDVFDTFEKITDDGLASSSAKLLPVGSVMYSSRASIGKIGIAHVPVSTNQGFTNFIPRSGISGKWLAYALLYKTPEIENLSGSTTFKEVSKTSFKKLQIFLPTYSEQQKIVELMDHADALRKLKTTIDLQADGILPALFYQMFGDPATNPMGWKVKRMGEICEVISGATPKTSNPNYWNGDVMWATPKDLSKLNSWILTDTLRKVTYEGFHSCSTQLLPKGTVLLSSRAPIGLVAIAGSEMCTNQGFKNLVCNNEVDECYIFTFCKLMASFFQTLGRGATFKEISKTIVENLEVPVPDLEVQAHFHTLFYKLHKLSLNQRKIAFEIDSQFNLMLHRAFTGDLTAKWREAHMKELLEEMQIQAKALKLEVPE